MSAPFPAGPHSYVGTGGIVFGGTALSTGPHTYTGSGGIVFGGTAVTSRPVYGNAPSFDAPIWQKPPYSTNPYQLDESKLPPNLIDVWLFNEGGGTLVRSLKRRAIGLLTGPWTGSRGGPALNFESNPNTGNLNQVALANVQTTTETPEALQLVGGHEFSYEVLIRHETLTWSSGIGVGNSEIVALDGTGTLHEDGKFTGAQDVGVLTIEAYTTVANPIVGAWRTFADFSSTLPNGKWCLVHAVWRYGGSDGFGKGHIFIDGKEVGYQLQETPGSDGTLTSRGLPLTIGSALDVTHTNIGDDPWPGMMAHLIIWNRGLTDAEIRRRVHDGYGFIRQIQPRHTWFLVPAAPPILTRSVPQTMVITTATTRLVPQFMWLDHAKRSVPQGLKVGGLRQAVPQLMLTVVDTKRAVPQHMALSPFVRSVPQHMQLSPAGTRSITQSFKAGITLVRSVPQHFLPSYGGTTQAPRSVPQHAVLKLKGSHKPPKTNNRDIPQFLLASPKPRGVPQSGAISKVGITRFVFQTMTISLSAGIRSIPQHAAAGKLGTIRSVAQSVVARSMGTIRSVPQHMLLSAVSGRFIRSVPQHAVLSVDAIVRLVPQTVATDRTAPLARTVHQQVVILEQLVRSVTQDATVAEVSVRSVPQHAKLKATNIRSVPQHMQAGGTTVSQRGIPVVSIGKIPVVVVPSEPEVELSIK